MKIDKNPYPLPEAHDETVKPSDRIDQIKLRRHDAPAPLGLDLPTKIVILDHFNTNFEHCELCLLPYSYKPSWHDNEEINTCIFCYLLHQQYPPTIYVQLEGNPSVAIEDKTVRVNKRYFTETFESEMELMAFLREEIKKGHKETSLDQFF